MLVVPGWNGLHYGHTPFKMCDDGADFGVFICYSFSFKEMHPVLINQTAYVNFSKKENSLTVFMSARFIPVKFLFRDL